MVLLRKCRISPELVVDMLRTGNRIEAEVLSGLPDDAVVVGVQWMEVPSKYIEVTVASRQFTDTSELMITLRKLEYYGVHVST